MFKHQKIKQFHLKIYLQVLEINLKRLQKEIVRNLSNMILL